MRSLIKKLSAEEMISPNAFYIVVEKRNVYTPQDL